MALVTNVVLLPDGTVPAFMRVRIQLIASTTGALAAGAVTATDALVEGVVDFSSSNGTWSRDLVLNSAIIPANTYYRITETVGQLTYVSSIRVTGPGTVADMLIDAPASLASAGSEAYTTAAIAAHVAAVDPHSTYMTSAEVQAATVGGDLTGTVANAQIAGAAVTDVEVAPANKDGATGTASMRTLGTGAQQAAAGNDTRITGATQKASNLSDLASLTTARTNLGFTEINLVKDFGADPTGVSSSYTALNNAQNATLSGTAGAGQIIFSPGDYLFDSAGILLRKSNITFQGSGVDRTRLFAAASLGALIQSSTSFPNTTNVTFQDMTIDAADLVTTVVAVFGEHCSGITFRRCRFLGIPTVGLSLNGMSNVTLEECEFTRLDGIPKGTAISITQGGRNIAVRKCRFEWMLAHVSVDTGAETSDSEQPIECRVIDNYFDQWWWLLRAQASGSGGAVTYTATTVTDTGAAFSGLTANNFNVRALTSIRTGTLTTSTSTRIADTTANFVTAGAKRGQIIRTAAAWAVIDDVESATVLRIDGWRSLTPASWSTTVAPPATTTAYTLYDVALGLVQSFASTVLTVSRWHDLTGASVTPAAGTLYELMYSRPNYQLHMERAARNSLIQGNRLRRGWSDQISVFGYSNVIANNIIEDGEDMGITVQDGHRNIVIGNRIKHQGAGGIFLKNSYTNVTGNQISGTPWVNPQTSSLGGIIVYAATDCSITSNVCTSDGGPQERYGIAVTNVSTGNLISANKCVGFSVSGIRVDGASSTLGVNKIEGNDTSLSFAALQTAQQINMTGAGSPETVITAAIGSFYRRTDGSTGTALYVKESGTGNIGWTPLGGSSADSSGRQFKSALYYASGGDTSNDATLATAANTAYAAPFTVGAAATFDRITCEVTTASGASATGRLVVYNSTLGYPSSVLLDAGTIDPTTTGTKELTISLSLQPGLYWLAYVTDATATAPVMRARSDTSIYVGHTASTSANRAGYTCTATGGAAPSPFSSTVATGNTMPKIMLRAA